MRQAQPSRNILVAVLCIILGLIVGVGLGLVLSRGIQPPRQSSDAFASLGANTKEEYIVLVGAAYALDHDLERAQAYLDRLAAPNINHWIASLIDRYSAEERDQADIRALMKLAHGLGVDSPAVLAYVATLTPPPTSTPLPTLTASVTPIPPTEEPAAVPPTPTVQPSDTPQPQPTNTLPPLPTPTAAPSDTPVPPTPTAAPSNTPRPQPTNTSEPQPTNTPAAKWAWTAQLVGPGQEGQTCSDGFKLLRVTVLDAAGNQIPGVWVYEQWTDLYQVSGHKGEDPFWGPGEVEFSQGDGGRLCIASGEGGACESDFTRNLSRHDPPPLDDLWAAGYCQCCEPEITKERCRELRDLGNCVGIVTRYAWRVEFKRSW